jgi:hypothetical protein
MSGRLCIYCTRPTFGPECVQCPECARGAERARIESWKRAQASGFPTVDLFPAARPEQGELDLC